MAAPTTRLILGDKRLPAEPDTLAPDGSQARLLFQSEQGGLAHFTVPAGGVTRAVRHRTVEEIWFVVEGRGQIWRRFEGTPSVLELEPGTSCTIPLGCEFQFRSDAGGDLVVLIATMPAWPGDDEAIFIEGEWTATVDAG